MKIIPETITLITKTNFEHFKKQLLKNSYSKFARYYALKCVYNNENNEIIGYNLVPLTYSEISICTVIDNCGLFPILK